jgi:hypothetical protein
MTLITFNLVLVWFDAMGFFAYQPVGENIDLEGERFGLTGSSFNFIILMGVILGLIGIILSRFTVNINAFSMILFMEAFWLPYIASTGIFYKIFIDVPYAFLGIIGIFSAMMIGVFLIALIEMNSSTVVSG